mmetsp:Transcript_12020/g.37013  ORF Transcript_12020/g.37013 Transcript_12020/m.37013 type:complete len:113 (-) Transcript_12020:15-353(-)
MLDDTTARLGDAVAAPGPANRGLRVQPRTGALCLFWSLNDDGEIDATSWHGGARVVRGAPRRDYWDAGKWTLQSFREVPPRFRGAARRSFVAASRTTEAGEGGGLRWTEAPG